MKPERKIINDELWEFANKLDEINTSISMYNVLLKDLENPLKATSYDKESSASVNGSIVETAVILRERYNKSIEECTKKKEICLKAFEEYISPLKFHCKLILRAKYIEGMNIRQIADKLNYSDDGIKVALRKSQDILYSEYHKN